ncbi:MAG: NAD(P)H-dependent oxidoreductase [Limnobacter sp.]|nr:NAD(P)H-dependent oxidoreductase [Limnobacter sp.]
MKKLLIVYHSMTSGSLQMARAAAEGAAQEPQTKTRMLHASDTKFEDVLEADGYIFVTPETLGSMSGLMKDFFDRTYYPVMNHVQGRPYAAMVCAGSDGSNAVRQIQRITTGWRLKAIAEPLIVCTHAQTPEAILKTKCLTEEDLQPCREVGQAIALGLAMGLF